MTPKSRIQLLKARVPSGTWSPSSDSSRFGWLIRTSGNSSRFTPRMLVACDQTAAAGAERRVEKSNAKDFDTRERYQEGLARGQRTRIPRAASRELPSDCVRAARAFPLQPMRRH